MKNKPNWLYFLFIILAAIPGKVIGFSYEYQPFGYCTSAHILTVNPYEHPILPVRAKGRQTVATLAQQYSAIAAINGGFWKANGDPAGILKINHQWHGTPFKPRGAIGWSLHGQKVLIDQVMTNYPLTELPVGKEIEVIPASNPPYTTKEDWKELEHIVGGTPILVRNGLIVEDHSSEQTLLSFLTKKHPRTAVGIKGSGEWVFVVVDSCFYGFFGGMTIQQLAEFMLELGCIEAVNLDGGGSSTMVLAGVVVNEPAGKLREGAKLVEAVSDAILILPAH